jgi:very-short-patch-repair endonuclease
MFKYKRDNPLNSHQSLKQYNFRGNCNHLNLIEIARKLRRSETTAEAIFWSRLRGRRWRKLKFRRQHQIGEFIVDFYCDELRLVIELDGGIHLTSLVSRRDREKEEYLNSIGMNIIRIANSVIVKNVDAALHYVSERIDELATK